MTALRLSQHSQTASTRPMPRVHLGDLVRQVLDGTVGMGAPFVSVDDAEAAAVAFMEARIGSPLRGHDRFQIGFQMQIAWNERTLNKTAPRRESRECLDAFDRAILDELIARGPGTVGALRQRLSFTHSAIANALVVLVRQELVERDNNFRFAPTVRGCEVAERVS